MHQRILTSIPYDSIQGLDDAKLAMLCLAANKDIKGILIKGPSGVGKTALVRAVAQSVMGGSPEILPANATEGQVFGSLDIENAIMNGGMRLEPGLLQKANGSFLCMDDINLFDRRFVRSLMGAITEGRVRVEREGVSAVYDVDTSIVATMNLREAPLSRNVSDLFEISVSILPSDVPAFREAVMHSNLDCESSEDSVEPSIVGRVETARKLLPEVSISDQIIASIVDACISLGVRGYRGELASIRVAKTVAALDGRTEVNADDARTAMYLCLGHRRERTHTSKKKENASTVNFYSESHMKRFIHDERKNAEGEVSSDPSKQLATEVVEDISGPAVIEDAEVEIGEMFAMIDLKEDLISKEHMDSQMMRKSIKDDGRDGRYISARQASGPGADIAVDATIRSAAPYQKVRRDESGDDRIHIRKQDLMEKVREKRTSCMFLFMIDTSGSLIIRGRMRAVKAAILSMLNDHYVRKDTVGIMEFNEAHVGMLMAPTRSVGGVKRLLEDLNVGKKTPLSEALSYAGDFVSGYTRTHPAEHCYIIIMTDGKANIPLVEDADPFEESLRIAMHMDIPNTQWVVVDTASDPKSDGHAARLSFALRAPYYCLNDLRAAVEATDGHECAVKV